MAIDETLATHIRTALADVSHLSEVKMFGGLGFMLNGNMVAACSDRGLLVRVGEVGEAEALKNPGSQLMVMGGRPMRGYVRVTGTLNGPDVERWLRLARAFVETLPPKKSEAKPKRKNTARK